MQKLLSKNLILLFCIPFLTHACQQKKKNTTHQPVEKKKVEVSYPDLLNNTAKQKELFHKKYQKGTLNEKKEVIHQAQTFLIQDIDNYFTSWEGTRWSFNGISRTPKQGSIACGYFVTTVLQDMGFNIPRIKWSQAASQTMIKALSTNIKTFSNKSISDIENYIKKEGKGVYIVGLDTHVGFIYYVTNDIYFVHSNYYEPEIGVMKQKIKSKNPLNDSKYRMIGKILSPEMTKKWILNIKY
ncbi:hypothetical protein [Apibacter sp. HY039]|uniref:hypothetical protein n=1 Tax=Apibacter sp. HY039 TaxID=2501476 RepID=UPI000FEBA416|nr:hypothetical protein [Apibacter sp. HY039]